MDDWNTQTQSLSQSYLNKILSRTNTHLVCVRKSFRMVRCPSYNSRSYKFSRHFFIRFLFSFLTHAHKHRDIYQKDCRLSQFLIRVFILILSKISIRQIRTKTVAIICYPPPSLRLHTLLPLLLPPSPFSHIYMKYALFFKHTP